MWQVCNRIVAIPFHSGRRYRPRHRHADRAPSRRNPLPFGASVPTDRGLAVRWRNALESQSPSIRGVGTDRPQCRRPRAGRAVAIPFHSGRRYRPGLGAERRRESGKVAIPFHSGRRYRHARELGAGAEAGNRAGRNPLPFGASVPTVSPSRTWPSPLTVAIPFHSGRRYRPLDGHAPHAPGGESQSPSIRGVGTDIGYRVTHGGNLQMSQSPSIRGVGTDGALRAHVRASRPVAIPFHSGRRYRRPPAP